MTEKEMIEEMGNTLYCKQDKFDLSNPFEVAKAVVEEGYYKVPEGAVVLTEDEWEKYQITQRDWNAIYYDGIDKARKETAREVLDKVYDWGKGFFIEHSLMEEDEFYGILDEVKKLFLNVVEVK